MFPVKSWTRMLYIQYLYTNFMRSIYINVECILQHREIIKVA